ncbi:MAG: hypothetical protein ACMV0I_04685 [Pseudomonas sp.]
METAIDVEQMTAEQARIAELETKVYRLAGMPDKQVEFELARKELERAKSTSE